MAALQPGASKLFVQNLPTNAAEASLKQFFGQYGEVSDVFIPKDRLTGMGKGTAFVTFVDPSLVGKVVAAGATQEIAHGVFITVEAARPRMPQGQAPPMQTMQPMQMMQPGGMQMVYDPMQQPMGMQPGSYAYNNGNVRPPDPPKIFCSNVPPTATKEILQTHFQNYGPVTDCYIPMTPDGVPKGTAFVTFQDESGQIVDSICALGSQHDLGMGIVITVQKARPKDPLYQQKFGGGAPGYGAVRAMPQMQTAAPYQQPMQMQQQMMMGMQPQMMMAPAPAAYKPLPESASSGHRLFVTKIPPNVDRQMVESHFRQFGEVSDFFMPGAPDRHKGIAFVTFSDPAIAEMMKSQPQILAGSQLVVETAVARHSGGGGPAMQGGMGMGMMADPAGQQMQAMQQSPDGLAPNEEGKYKVFVAQLDFNATQEQLMAEFQQFGQVDDVYIPKNPATGQPKGIAYITFPERESASKCLAAPPPTFNGRPVNCMPSTPKGAKGAGKGMSQMPMQMMMMPVQGFGRR